MMGTKISFGLCLLLRRYRGYLFSGNLPKITSGFRTIGLSGGGTYDIIVGFLFKHSWLIILKF
jgi:hypothetical protein